MEYIYLYYNDVYHREPAFAFVKKEAAEKYLKIEEENGVGAREPYIMKVDLFPDEEEYLKDGEIE